MQKIVKHSRHDFIDGGFWDGDILYPKSVHGFFSVLSLTLEWLTKTKAEANKINAKYSFMSYKDFDEDEDVWEKFFSPPNKSITINQNHQVDFNALSVATTDYSFLEYKMNYLTPYIKKYFSPSNLVTNTYDKFKSIYDINLNETIAVHYRATDKNRYLHQVNAENIIPEIQKLLDENTNSKVLVQSDQWDVIQLYMDSFKERAFYIKELPVDKTSSGLHINRPYHFRLKYGIDYLASILLISQSKHIVTHYGNGGFWTCLYRGNFENVKIF